MSTPNVCPHCEKKYHPSENHQCDPAKLIELLEGALEANAELAEDARRIEWLDETVNERGVGVVFAHLEDLIEYLEQNPKIDLREAIDALSEEEDEDR